MRGRPRFLLLLIVAAIVSTLLHELGHCVFYWAQGVPAAMSLVKEFPLRDITALEYAIGSAGGVVGSLAIALGAAAVHRSQATSVARSSFTAALALASTFYFALRGLLALLQQRGGELGDVAGLVGLGHVWIVVAYAAISIALIATWLRTTGLAPSPRRLGAGLGLFVVYVVVLVAVQSFDAAYLWQRFPTIAIDDGRLYNEHRTAPPTR